MSGHCRQSSFYIQTLYLRFAHGLGKVVVGGKSVVYGPFSSWAAESEFQCRDIILPICDMMSFSIRKHALSIAQQNVVECPSHVYDTCNIHCMIFETTCTLQDSLNQSRFLAFNMTMQSSFLYQLFYRNF